MKKDYFFAIIAGLITGALLIPTVRNLGIKIPYGEFLFIVIWPAIFVLGVWLVHFLRRRFLWLWQLTKFAEVGFLNTAIDFGVLNFLIFITGIPSGLYFSLFKTVSFIVANINSYVWNRFWVFFAEGGERAAGKEYAQFLLVSVIGIIVNVGIASLVVNFIPAQLGLTPTLWANVGAAAGVGASLIWNFLGYKFIVFKVPNNPVNRGLDSV
ncbi:MAG: GtrA family protein [Candidatus Niyogibacteria bacterium]|nr:MAG: GtrA family protein [Candidatus Niyogibacteria bacterium]